MEMYSTLDRCQLIGRVGVVVISCIVFISVMKIFLKHCIVTLPVTSDVVLISDPGCACGVDADDHPGAQTNATSGEMS